MIYAIIAAGGVGTRFGADKPKQLVKIDGESILARTAKIFDNIDVISKTVVACPPDRIDECTRELSCVRKACVIAGGKTRNDTIMNAIEFIEKNFGLDSETIVVTHDAVRPFVTEEIILKSISAAEKYGASVAAIEAVDTIIECENGFIKSIPERRKMFQVQTPQTFKAMKLKELYLSLNDEEREILTDCSKIFVLRGETVAVVQGDRRNIKITYSSDIDPNHLSPP